MEIADQEKQFTAWTRDHAAIIYRVVNGFAADDDRNDLLQEVFLAIWKSIPAFRGQAKPTTYLYRVCHNAALLWTRTERNYRRKVEAFGESTPENSGPDSESQLDQRLKALYAAIRLLEPSDRSLILMSLDGTSYREMAEVVGLSENNVGVRINRIKKRLTLTLRGTEHGPE